MIRATVPLDDVDLPANTSPIVGWPIAVDAAGAAALFHLSPRAWWRAHSAGKVPLPIRVAGGRAVRWRLDELRAWAEAGCPPREKWQELREAT